MSLGRITRFLIIVGCFIGAFVVSASNIHEQNSKVLFDQEPKNNVDNAAYQVQKWEKAYRELKRKEAASFRMSTVQVTRLKKEMKETKKEFLYWINKRSEELKKNCAEAKSKGRTADVERYSKELEELSRKAEELIKESDEKK